MRDPKVIDPPGFDPAEAWQGCRDYVDKCGGLTHDDGEVNWRAAAGADPGCCSCPNCGEMYWSWGRVVECLDCQFQFPTDWWAMYSYGVHAAKVRNQTKHLYRHEERMEHPYYRYGFENPVEDAWEQRDKIEWAKVLG